LKNRDFPERSGGRIAARVSRPKKSATRDY
jgi:hypothetical protein